MHLHLCFKCLLLTFLVSCVDGKGAKVRAKNRNSGRDQKKRMPGFGSSGYDGSSGPPLTPGASSIDYLGRYMFRNASNEERLLAYLFQDYDPVARAVMDTSKPVEVFIDFVLLRIHGLDERSQVLTITGLVIAEWKDDRLTWDPEKFGNVSDIIIKAEKIWLPELAVMNGADELIPDFERIRVLLNYDGTLHWEPGGIFRTTCDIDITFFPFDTQACPLFIGAYSYYSSKMNITNRSKDISTHDFQPNGEWEVFHTRAVWNITVLDCCLEQGYPHVIFTLHLKRRYKFYMMNIVLPCIMLSILIMIGFFLPPDAGEKISLGISVLLAFTVFLLMIADNIPRTSLAIPLMVVYLTATMSLGTISICMTVIVLNFHHRGARSPVPPWMKKLFLGFFARCVCLKTTYRQCSKEKVYVKKHCHSNHKTENNGILDDMELLSLTINHRPLSQHVSQQNGPRHLNLHDSPPESLLNLHSMQKQMLQRDGLSKPLPPPPPALSKKQDSLRSRHRMSSQRRRRRGSSSSSEGDPPDHTRDWHELAHVLDRLFFWFLFLLMTASGTVILLYPKYTGTEEQEIIDARNGLK